MRYLHPVTAHEQFIASGTYRYFQAGQALKLTESWSIHEHPDGEQFIRVDYDSRFYSGVSLLVEALRSPTGRIPRFDVNYFDPAESQGIRSLRATYIRDDYVSVGFSVNGGERDYKEVALPADTMLLPPGNIFRGMMISQLQGASMVSVMKLLLPQNTFETAELWLQKSEADPIQIGKQSFSVTQYRLQTESHAEMFWLDDHAVPIKSQVQRNGIDTELLISNYAHRS